MQGSLGAQLNARQEHLAEITENLEAAIVQWQTELNLGLGFVENMDTYNLTERRDIMRLAEQLVTEYKVVWGNMVKETVISDLITEFNKANVNLREYALERESLENGRAIIRSNRDRMNPMTPRELLKELREKEAEQFEDLLTELKIA